MIKVDAKKSKILFWITQSIKLINLNRSNKNICSYVRLISITAFFTGFAAMMLQIAAFRVVVPIFGSTLHIWGIIVGVVMFTAALGYYVGGKAAHWFLPRRAIFGALVAAGLFIVAIPITSQFFIDVFNTSILEHTLLFAFFYILLFYGLPIFLLDMVFPLLIQIRNRRLETTGYATGSIFSSEATGSVIGTLAAAFIALPFLGIKETIYLASAISFLMALAWLFSSRQIIEVNLPLFAANQKEFHPHSFKRTFPLVLVFITGASILAIEMTAFKVIVPLFGASLYIWGGIIAMVIIALSLGYRIGGDLADDRPELNLLLKIVFVAGLLAALMPFLIRVGLKQGVILFGQDVLLTYLLFLFILPILLLSIASPFVTRILNRELVTTGFSAGSVFGVSTIGSAIGIIIATFLALPLFGSELTLLIIGLLLLGVSTVGLIFVVKASLRRILPIFAVVFILILISYNFFPVEHVGVIHRVESFYGLVEVIEEEDGRRILDINRSGRWSVWHPDTVMTGMYFDYFSPVYYLLEERENLDILIIGHAGGVFSRQWSYFFGDRNVRIDGVELDSEVTRAARMFFGVDDHKNLTIINDDGRMFLQRTDKKYDAILIDAYVGQLYIPFQVATKEFYQQALSRLKPGGVLAQFVLDPLPKAEFGLISCMSGAISSAGFDNIYIYREDNEKVLVASQRQLGSKLAEMPKLVEHKELAKVAEEIANSFSQVRPGRCVLTDNKAPTELIRELGLIKKSLSF